MKRFAIVNKSGVVENIVISEEYRAIEFLLGANNLIIEETEVTGVAFIGATYRQDKEKFMPYRPFDTWSFNGELWQWEAPVSMPTDGKPYFWNGLTNNWAEVIVDVNP